MIVKVKRVGRTMRKRRVTMICRQGHVFLIFKDVEKKEWGDAEMGKVLFGKNIICTIHKIYTVLMRENIIRKK